MIKLFSIVVLAAVIAVGIFAHNLHRYVTSPISDKPVSDKNQPVEVVIKAGSSFTQATHTLQQAGFISRPLFFKLHAMYEEKTQSIKSGEYRFSRLHTPAQILQHLVDGKTIQYKLTVVEGRRFQDFFQALRAHPKINRVINDIDEIKARLNIDKENIEGLFLPDTYTFSAGTDDIDIVRQSYYLLRDFLDQEWPKRSQASYVSSPYEALILASIIEKETSVPAERARIAGVFISRLTKNMPLQTDPTVIYGLGDSFDGNLTRKHLQTDHPYNTYTRRGLPPAPIALAGRAAILAVLHPRITGDLYFVSKNDGTHFFSKTYRQHLQAVRKYQLGKK